MDAEWQEIFRERMRGFAGRRSDHEGDVAVSIKVRVASGCFHREHSPRGYALIDSYLRGSSPDFEFVEHESGPELLVYLAVATAGLTLAKSVIDLITAIIQARAEGVKKGDHPDDPLELIVRRIDNGQEYREEFVLRIGHSEQVDAKAVEEQVQQALHKLSKNEGRTKPPSKSRKG